MHTEHLPALAQSFPVFSVDDEHDGMTIVIVPVPYRAYSTLSPEVPEFQDRGREGDLSHCPGREDPQWIILE